jgi:hypothetical protein
MGIIVINSGETSFRENLAKSKRAYENSMKNWNPKKKKMLLLEI